MDILTSVSLGTTAIIRGVARCGVKVHDGKFLSLAIRGMTLRFPCLQVPSWIENA